MKKRWPLLLVLAAIVWIGSCIWMNSKNGIIFYVRRHMDKLQVYAETCMDIPEDYANYKNWNTRYDQNERIVVFQTSYLGFGSQADEKGFYYAPDGRPRAFGCDLGEEQREALTLFLGEGDNYVLTEKIADNWFWYEQHW